MYQLTPEETAIADANPELVEVKTNYYINNIINMTPDIALAMARQHVVFSIIRRTNPLYGHDDDSLNELYEELKAIEDAETGADRELDYQGPDCTYLSTEEIKAYVLKYNMY